MSVFIAESLLPEWRLLLKIGSVFNNSIATTISLQENTTTP